MDTIKIERPANIPSDFKAVVCCTSCHEPVAFGLGFLERITPDTIRFADGTKPLLGTSVFRECPKCGYYVEYQEQA